jgi:hypothetical protein
LSGNRRNKQDSKVTPFDADVEKPKMSRLSTSSFFWIGYLLAGVLGFDAALFG